MAHCIDQSTGRAAFMSANGRPAWHNLGTVVSEAQFSAQALVLGGMDWDVVLESLSITSTGANVPGAFATVRSDTRAVLGVVGARYTPLQNREAFAFMDEAIGSGLAKYDTCGALNGGRTVFLSVKLPTEIRVNGTDDISEVYALLANSHDGSGAVEVRPTKVRTVCANTLRMALSQTDGRRLKIRHTQGMRTRVDEARDVLGIVTRRAEEMNVDVNLLASVSMPETDLRDTLEQFFPVKRRPVKSAAAPAPAPQFSLDDVINATVGRAEDFKVAQEVAQELSDRTFNRNLKIVDEIIQLYHSPRNTLPGIRGSAWAGYNAISEYADHSGVIRGKSEAERLNNRAQSVLNGTADELKQSAFATVLDYARAKV